MSVDRYSDFKPHEPTYGQPKDLVGGFGQSCQPPYRLPHRHVDPDMYEEMLMMPPEQKAFGDGLAWDELDRYGDNL